MTRNLSSRSRARTVRKNIPIEEGNYSTRVWSRPVRLFPILFFQAYLGFTVILFRWGPWPWPVRDGTKLYAYLLLVHLSLLFGYLSAANNNIPASSQRPKYLKILVLSLIVSVVMLLPTVIARAPEGAFDIAAAIADPGSAYVAAREWRQTSLFSLAVSYIRMFLSPLLVALFPLTVFYRQQLGRSLLVLSLAFILASPLLSIATGTNKAVFDFVLVTAWIALAAHLSGIGRVSVVRRTFLLVIVAVLFLFAFWFFTQGILTRPGASAVYFSRTRTFADADNIFVRWLPGEARTGAMALASYLTQGYYALYLALQLPFVPTFGVGNSFFLVRNVVRLTGFDRLEAIPYPMRVESTYGWSAYGNWSTIYPWLASDVSFPGTLIVVFLVGRLFAVTWLDSLQGRNPWAVVLFSQLIIMLFYFPANNQILQSGESLFAFIVTLFLWFRSRRMPRHPRSDVLRTTTDVQLERSACVETADT